MIPGAPYVTMGQRKTLAMYYVRQAQGSTTGYPRGGPKAHRRGRAEGLWGAYPHPNNC